MSFLTYIPGGIIKNDVFTTMLTLKTLSSAATLPLLHLCKKYESHFLIRDKVVFFYSCGFAHLANLKNELSIVMNNDSDIISWEFTPVTLKALYVASINDKDLSTEGAADLLHLLMCCNLGVVTVVPKGEDNIITVASDSTSNAYTAQGMINSFKIKTEGVANE